MKPMHIVLLSIVVALGETERAVLSSANAAISEDTETTGPSLGRRLIQMGRVKQQAFKVSNGFERGWLTSAFQYQWLFELTH